MNETPEAIAVDKLATRLRRLWVGTLYIGISAVYILLLGLLLIFNGWRPALLCLFLTGLIQLFRYVADDVDRIGWILRRGNIDPERSAILEHRRKLHRLLLAMILLLNLTIVYQMYAVSHWQQASVVAVGLVIVEVMFGQIRATNRQMDYRSPVYGIRHSHPISAGSDVTMVEEKLARLKQMAARGEISEKAYKKVTDRMLIKQVMDE